MVSRLRRLFYFRSSFFSLSSLFPFVIVVKFSLFLLFRPLQRFVPRFGVEIRWVDDFHSFLFRKLLGAFPGHHHMSRLVHNGNRSRNRVSDCGNAGNRTGFECFPFHNGRVQFIFTFIGKNSPFAGIKQWRVFHDMDRRFHGLYAGTALFQYFITFFQGGVQRFAIRLLALGAHV
ncbi:hypothetical protein D3C87_1603700 [compost metagenome]